MKKVNYILISLVILLSSSALADEADCTIEIEDVNTGTKYKIDHHFTFTQESKAQWKYFKLPGSTYNCNFAFFNLGIGTMLSCELDEAGNDFVQSDRSGNKEVGIKNNLTFRHNNKFYTLLASCK